MSFVRKFFTSAAVVVAEGALIGAALGDDRRYAALGAVIAVPLYATLGTVSQFTYAALRKVPYVLRAAGTSITTVLVGAVVSGYEGHSYRFSSRDAETGFLAAIPVGLTVAVVNGIVDYTAKKIPRKQNNHSLAKDLVAVHKNPKPQVIVSCRNTELKTTFKDDLINGGLAGFIAGGFAQLQVGFQEGPIGGAIGGVVCETIAHHLQQKGLSDRASILLAMAATALIDMGGLHSFGHSKNALIPYTDQDVSMHHGVFYLALMLSMVAVPEAKKHILPSLKTLFFTKPSRDLPRDDKADEDYKLSHGL